MKRTSEQPKREYQLDPVIAAAMRRPVRTDLTDAERTELKRLEKEVQRLKHDHYKH